MCHHTIVLKVVRWAVGKCGEQGIAWLWDAVLFRVVGAALGGCLRGGIDIRLRWGDVRLARRLPHRAGRHHPKRRAKRCLTLVKDALSDEIHAFSLFNLRKIAGGGLFDGIQIAEVFLNDGVELARVFHICENLIDGVDGFCVVFLQANAVPLVGEE